MKKRKLDQRADRAARQISRRTITRQSGLTLESLIMVLALLTIFTLIIIVTVLRVQHKGRNDEPIPAVATSIGQQGGGKSWKFSNKDN